MNPLAEMDRQGIPTGRKYVVVKQYSKTGSAIEVDRKTGAIGRRYDLIKKYV